MTERYSPNHVGNHVKIKDALEKKFGLVGHPKADRLFELAEEWYSDDDECNCGDGVIEPYYELLKDLLS